MNKALGPVGRRQHVQDAQGPHGRRLVRVLVAERQAARFRGRWKADQGLEFGAWDERRARLRQDRRPQERHCQLSVYPGRRPACHCVFRHFGHFVGLEDRLVFSSWFLFLINFRLKSIILSSDLKSINHFINLII